MILNLHKDILKRYEHHLYGGVLILYQVKTGQYWFGNESANEIIRLVDGCRDSEDIYAQILPSFEGYAPDEVRQSMETLIKELIDKQFLVNVSAAQN